MIIYCIGFTGPQNRINTLMNFNPDESKKYEIRQYKAYKIEEKINFNKFSSELSTKWHLFKKFFRTTNPGQESLIGFSVNQISINGLCKKVGTQILGTKS